MRLRRNKIDPDEPIPYTLTNDALTGDKKAQIISIMRQADEHIKTQKYHIRCAEEAGDRANRLIWQAREIWSNDV